MKCINRLLTGIVIVSVSLFASGCGKEAPVDFENAYQLYQTSEKYNITSAQDTSSGQGISYFADSLCVTDGADLGTEDTDSQVSGASGVFNVNTKKVTYSQNVFTKMYPASTTKILTAYLALKHGDLDSKVTVSENAANQASDSSVCGLHAGDVLTLRQLLFGLMMRSGNDAAIAIAEAVSGSVESFSELMNQEAQILGATGSHFVNPNGLQDEEHYTTVYDMYLFFSAAIQNEIFMDTITLTEYTVDYVDADGAPVQQIWTSTNKYLAGTETAPSGITVIGGKTGTTNDAGYCLVLLSTNEKSEQIISIVMKADCRDNLYYYMNELLYGFSH